MFPSYFFRCICSKRGRIGFVILFFVLTKYIFFFQSRTDFTIPEYCKKFILTLYVALSSSYVYMLPFSFVISLINVIPFSIQDVLYI